MWINPFLLLPSLSLARPFVSFRNETNKVFVDLMHETDSCGAQLEEGWFIEREKEKTQCIQSRE